MILGGRNPPEGLKQKVTRTHSRGRCLIMFVELMLLPERQRKSGYDSGVILSDPLWAKYMALWNDA